MNLKLIGLIVVLHYNLLDFVDILLIYSIVFVNQVVEYVEE